jgi:hypothetical protein
MAESENIVVGSVVYGESEIATLKAGKYIDLHTADKRFESDLKVSITAKDYDGSVEIEGEVNSDYSVPVEITTEAEMDALPIGAVFEYVGETTDKYENGTLYLVEESE